jgi:hypothetical protein
MQLAARLGKDGRRLSFCCEAGPCGYGVHRLLTGREHSCIVVAPSLIPTQSGRPGQDGSPRRGDADKATKLHSAGELTGIWIPDAAHEGLRDLVRARTAQPCAEIPSGRKIAILQPATVRYFRFRCASIDTSSGISTDRALTPLKITDILRILTTSVRLLVTAGLILALALRFDLAQAAELIRHANLRLIAATLLVLLITNSVVGWRWQLILSAESASPGSGTLLKLCLSVSSLTRSCRPASAGTPFAHGGAAE